MSGRAQPAALALALALGCANSPEAPSYLHNRTDYGLFADQFQDLLEPNYVPFMTDRVVLESGPARFLRGVKGLLGVSAEPPEQYLVLCRWADDHFPLRVAIEPPRIEVEVDEPGYRAPDAYVAAVANALALWEQGLEGHARFRLVERARDADLVLRLRSDEPPEADPDVVVLGATRLGGACRLRGGDPADGRLDVEFEVDELSIFVSDQHGLLLPDQVQRIALHEIGHALGMRGHSPIPADLMYRVVRDRLPRGELGAEDANSFLSLYRLAPGTIYTSLVPAPPSPAPLPAPLEAPRLALAPHVDARLGYEIQLPEGWTHLETAQGVVAVDGLTWDYEASFQLAVRRYDTIAEYLERYGSWHLGRLPVRQIRDRTLAGRPAREYVLAPSSDGLVEALYLVEVGDGRLLVVTAECPATRLARYEPWFEAVLASLELREEEAPGGVDRDYGDQAEGAPGS